MTDVDSPLTTRHQRPRVTLLVALKDLGWFFGLFSSIVGGISILQIHQAIVDFELSALLQWIVDGYGSLLAHLDILFGPVTAWIESSLRDLFHLDLVVHEHWRTLFTLAAIPLAAVVRSLLLAKRWFLAALAAFALSTISLATALLAATVPLSAGWLAQVVIIACMLSPWAFAIALLNAPVTHSAISTPPIKTVVERDDGSKVTIEYSGLNESRFQIRWGLSLQLAAVAVLLLALLVGVWAAAPDLRIILGGAITSQPSRIVAAGIISGSIAILALGYIHRKKHEAWNGLMLGAVFGIIFSVSAFDAPPAALTEEDPLFFIWSLAKHSGFLMFGVAILMIGLTLLRSRRLEFMRAGLMIIGGFATALFIYALDWLLKTLPI